MTHSAVDMTMTGSDVGGTLQSAEQVTLSGDMLMAAGGRLLRTRSGTATSSVSQGARQQICVAERMSAADL